MNLSYKVSFWKTRVRSDGYQVRWVVDGQEKAETLGSFGAAEGFRSDLRQAYSKGEAFDVETGLPVSMLRRRKEEAARKVAAISCLKHFTEYIDQRWPRVSGHERRSMAESMTAVMWALLPHEDAPDPKVLRTALQKWAFSRNYRSRERSAEIEEALKWAEAASPPVVALADLETMRTILNALASKLDGARAKPHYYSRRRRVTYNMLEWSVTRERLDSNPLDSPKLDWKPPTAQRVAYEVDPRAIGSREQIKGCLAGVSYVGRTQGPRFKAFFDSIYGGMLRPEEVAGLHDYDCDLPKNGWGAFRIGDTKPAPGKDWTDNGEVHEERGLKQRAEDTTRTVPIPPWTVRSVRHHIDTYGVAPDGRIFRSVNGKPIHPSTYNRVWSRAREFGLSPRERRSKVLKRPYDLRHAGVTSRLYAGVPDRQVAEWAGHSVDVLRRIYSQILVGMDKIWHSRMDEFFDDEDPDDGPERSLS